MRNLFLILVLLNLGYAAWSAWIAQPNATGSVASSRAVGGITLVSELEPAALEAIESLQVAAPPAPPPPPPASAESSTVDRCISVGPFQELAQASAAQSALRSAGFTPNQRVVEGDIWVGYWVHLTDIPTREQAEEILERLRNNDISDSYIVPGGDESRQMISLGVFSEINRAATVREQVRALGYSPTVADRSRRATLYWVDVLAPANATIDLDSLQPAGRINRLEQRTCATVAR
jgi:hypothetical protein